MPRAKRNNSRPKFPPVRDIRIGEDSSVSDIVSEMGSSGGFQARYFADCVDILESMCRDKDCVKFLSFPAAIISTGTRGVIKELVKRKLCDAIITTCGTLDHDIARAYKPYLSGGEFAMDDVLLEREGYHRLGNVLIPVDSYGPLVEKKVQKVLSDMYSNGEKEPSTQFLCKRLGESLSNDKDSILYWAAKNEIPVFVPGITDGAVGSQCWLFYQTHRDFKIDLLKDEQALSDIVYSAKKSGAFMLGGGISKHHTLWWNQFREGLDYAAYITSATELDGSLSGAQVREAISWGKVSTKARQVTVFGEVTTLLPFAVAALIQRLSHKAGN
ncbi:MAG: deoxyhypusine synthase [Thaumarchaeota archaeon]|nr:deoxyhypusine synthase [Nitrososphaerota archaeon]